MDFLRILTLSLVLISGSLWPCNQSLANPGHIPLQKAPAKEMKNISTDEMMKSYLEMSSFRHQILSENVANANTPGYKANEVAAPSTYKELVVDSNSSKKVRMNVTSSNHLIGKNKERGKFSSQKLQNPYETKPNGNNVSLQQQMLLMAENKQDYNLALKNYASSNSLISTVLGK